VASRARSLSREGLAQELRQLGSDYPKLKDDELFVAWFVWAYVLGNRKHAVGTLTGYSGEKGLDAIVIDESSRLVALVQGKYAQKLMASSEPYDSVMAFAGLAQRVAGPASDFEDLLTEMEGKARSKLRVARERLLEREYRLNLHYATLRRCSRSLTDEAKRAVRAVKVSATQKPRLTILDGDGVMSVLADYLDGVAPPVPVLELPTNGRPESQEAAGSGVTSWIFSMNGLDAGALIDQAGGPKLFARNIRGFLGETRINEEMKRTLRREPEAFWYLNNGITIVCDDVSFESSGAEDRLVLSNPQIINGQQTTYVLHEMAKSAIKASVSVRVISLPRSVAKADFAHYEQLVAKIVEATNSQNRIKSSDLRSNDRVQVKIEREFQKRGYHYQRKRAGTAELAALVDQHEWRLSKVDLAKAVVGCESATLVRRGTEPLFEDPYYKRTFRHGADQLLCRWWLARLVDKVAWGSGERHAAKGVVLHFLWGKLEADIRGSEQRFRELCEAGGLDWPGTTMGRAIRHAFKGTLQFFRKNRRLPDGESLELSAFFKRQDVEEGFDRFWRSQANSHRKHFMKALNEFRAELRS
jgi:hypothetical protein